MASEGEHRSVAFHGRGKTVDEAIQQAWNSATQAKRGGEEATFDVLRLSVHGTNPITGYSVILAPSSSPHH